MFLDHPSITATSSQSALHRAGRRTRVHAQAPARSTDNAGNPRNAGYEG